jgi:hypothetical protein
MTFRQVVAAAVLGIASSACAQRLLEPRIHPAQAALPVVARGELKVHMKSGELYVLRSWRLSESPRSIAGDGDLYGLARGVIRTGAHSIPLDAVALLETNARKAEHPGGLQGLAFMTTVLGGIAGYCSISPKSCFGSCPTFYAEDDDEHPVAEGFSSSIASVLEASDVDALPSLRVRGPTVSLLMRNEAMETHAVRSAHLLLARRPAGGQVVAGIDGRFHAATRPVAAERCSAAEGDCLAAVRAFDGRERFSAADALDLARREEMEVAFPPVDGRMGVVVGARASLMTTFLFYQSMAYTGRRVGEVLAAMENAGPEGARSLLGMGRVLGGIEVEASVAGGPWTTVGEYHEAGPLARDVLVLPAAEWRGPVRIRLRMAGGAWRVDSVSLVHLGAPVDVVRVPPVRVERGGRPDPEALAALLDPDRHLVTTMGDAYRLVFEVPRGFAGAEAFLESRGYYYEWMRSEWLADEDAAMAALVVTRPEEALRRLAPLYKRQEAAMEGSFWASRFRK